MECQPAETTHLARSQRPQGSLKGDDLSVRRGNTSLIGAAVHCRFGTHFPGAMARFRLSLLKVALSSLLALANGISFYHQPLQIQGLTSILFSIFLVTQMFSNIDRLVIPRLEDGLQLFESRERDSGLYSWLVLITSNILIEMFWQTLISVLVFVCWYYPTGLQYNGDAVFGTAERGGLAFVLIWLFNLWGCTLSQGFAVGIRRTATAEQMATLCFWLTVVFCGFVNRRLRPCRYKTG